MFHESPLLIEQKQWFDNQFFIPTCKTILGVTPEQLDSITRDSCFSAICERFKNITVEDIQLAFKTHVQSEKVFVLTRDEFIKPIQVYWSKKMIVKREIETELEKVKEEQSIKQKEIEFKKEAMQIYLDCLERKDGVWTGSEYHANALGRSFADSLHMKPELKKQLWINAQLEYKERNAKFQVESGLNVAPPLPEVIYSRMIVEHMLTLGVDKTGFPLVVD